MAEDALYLSELRPALEKSSGQSVPQPMGRNGGQYVRERVESVSPREIPFAGGGHLGRRGGALPKCMDPVAHQAG
jgi:hypothetical protein